MSAPSFFPLGLLPVAMLAGCSPVFDQESDTVSELSGNASSNETAAGWATCSNGPKSNCGGRGGKGKIVHTQLHVDVAGGGRTGVAEEYTPAGVAYGTSYWYRETAEPTFLATSIDYSTDLYVPRSVGSKYQAIEWDSEQHLDGYVYNYAWQANRAAGRWRWYEYGGKPDTWHDSGIPFEPFTTDTWHHIHAHYSVHGTTITNDYLEIDGVRHVPTVSTAHSRMPKGGQKLNIGLQMDQDAAGDEMTLYWDNVELAYTNDAPPACGAPQVLAPFDGEDGIGPTLSLATVAPPCIVTTKCYLASSGGTAVATGGNALDGVSVPVPLGPGSIGCNGWDKNGKSYVGAHNAFTRTH